MFVLGAYTHIRKPLLIIIHSSNNQAWRKGKEGKAGEDNRMQEKGREKKGTEGKGNGIEGREWQRK